MIRRGIHFLFPKKKFLKFLDHKHCIFFIMTNKGKCIFNIKKKKTITTPPNYSRCILEIS